MFIHVTLKNGTEIPARVNKATFAAFLEDFKNCQDYYYATEDALFIKEEVYAMREVR
jgi:hypothetical protein